MSKIIDNNTLLAIFSKQKEYIDDKIVNVTEEDDQSILEIFKKQ